MVQLQIRTLIRTFCSNEKIALVHNGIIDNANGIRNRLIARGYEFKSDTDSEALVHMISIGLESGQSPLESVRQSLRRVTGTWGICVLFKEYDEIICARNGSPLIIGRGNGENFISSDPHALAQHTSNVYYLEDGDLASVTKTNVEISRLEGGSSSTTISVIEEDWGEADLGGFPHYMLKEIHDQPDALRRCITGRLDLANGSSKLGGLNHRPYPSKNLTSCQTDWLRYSIKCM